MPVLVTGTKAYIGALLVPHLALAGHTVRVLVRDPARVARRRWARQVAVARGLLDPAPLGPALPGCESAHPLVHTRGAKARFEPPLGDGRR